MNITMSGPSASLMACMQRLLLGVGLLISGVLGMAVPITFQYQGHIVVDGFAFEGIGSFKFALLDENGATLWSNDETSVDGSEPGAAVELAISRGVYLIELGNTDITNMAAISASVFDVDAVFLRVWFDDGVNGVQQLAPDTPISSVAFAIRAASAERADSADTVTSLPDGLIESQHFASELKEQIDTLTGLLENLVAISSDVDDETLSNAGYAAFRTIEEDPWIYGSSEGRPAERYGHSSIWTGSEMIVWGGKAGGSKFLGTGGRYSQSGNTWTSLSPLGAPDPRMGHSAVWTGSEMVIWGGLSGEGRLASGGIYDSTTADWSSISLIDSPIGRNRHVSAWTGTSMLVWGGRSDDRVLADGGFYDVEKDEWRSFDLVGVPTEESASPSVIAEALDGAEGGAANWTAGVDEEAPFLNGAVHVLVEDGFAYVASNADDAISIFDVSDPEAVELVHSILYNSTNDNGRFPSSDGDSVFSDIDSNQFLNGVWYLAKTGDVLIASANSSQSITFFNVSNQRDPEYLASIVDTDDGGDLSHLDRPRWLRVEGELLLVGNGSFTNSSTGSNSGPAAVYFFDLSPLGEDTPAAPTYLNKIVDGGTILTIDGADATIELGVGAVEFAIHDSYLYLAASAVPKLYVINIEDPSDPRLVTTLEDEEGFKYLGVPRSPTLSADGKTLYVTSSGGEDALTILNVSEPSAPSLLFEVEDGVDGFDYLDAPLGVSVEGNLLAVTALNDDGITLIDVTDPAAPGVVAQFQNSDGEASALDGALGVALEGEIAYVTSNRSDSLTLVDARKSPRARMDANGVWTGEEWLVWGGRDSTGDHGDGFRVSLTDGKTPTEWSYLSADGAPSARSGHASVWTGSELIVWGGWSGAVRLGDGGRYDPESDTWTAVTEDGAPTARSDHVALWTGSEMLVLFGFDGLSDLADGYAYDPANDSWRTLTGEGPPLARRSATAVWTGTDVVVFGGRASGSVLGSVQLLNPAPAVHLFRKQ